MTLLSIELSDVGIIAAGASPIRILPVEGDSMASPGYAVQTNRQLVVGRAAAGQARLFPKQTNSRFWDRLDTEPLRRSGLSATSRAELAYSHLQHIWSTLRSGGDAVVFCVPGHYRRDQLGLLLGIARELDIAVKGFIPLALAAVNTAVTGGDLIHIDLHLHRCEATYLTTGTDVVQVETRSIVDAGIAHLYRIWANTAARAFLQATRFDPLHSAVSEQAVYQRLPDLLATLTQHPSVRFEITNGDRTYHMPLTRSLIIEAAQPVYTEIAALLAKLVEANDLAGRPLTIQLSRRACGLPGFKNLLAPFTTLPVEALAFGAAARGAAACWPALTAMNGERGPARYTRRPAGVPGAGPTGRTARNGAPPTHLLLGDIAFPIGRDPLVIGASPEPGPGAIQLPGSQLSDRHCSVYQLAGEVVLDNHSRYGTRLDGTDVEGPIPLLSGQAIVVGEPPTVLRLITCLPSDKNGPRR